MTIKDKFSTQFDGSAHYPSFMKQPHLHEKNPVSAFEESLQNNSFSAWFQPKISTKNFDVIAGEALVRWKNEHGKIVAPGEFIPILEHEGKIHLLDEYVFREVCSYQCERQKLGLKMVPISVNLSRCSLNQEDIVQTYKHIALDNQVSLDLVPIEITESVASTMERVKDTCEEFVQSGFHLHIDDFGMGYSSLACLASLPFEQLKIDRSLINLIGTTRGNVLVKGIIETTHDLGMQVVAEGVERWEQVDFLSGISCDQLQGYLFESPKVDAEFTQLLSANGSLFNKNRQRVLCSDGIARFTGLN